LSAIFEELASTIKEAFILPAQDGRPCFSRLPKNVMVAEIDYDSANVKIKTMRLSISRPEKNGSMFMKCWRTLKRPLIMTGGGVILGKASRTHPLARQYQIPVTGTLMGLVLFRERMPSGWAC